MGVIRIAREELTCCDCGGRIRKGERYQMPISKGTATSSKARCLNCVHKRGAKDAVRQR